MDFEAWGQGRLDWWEGEKARKQEGGGWAVVLGSGRLRSLCNGPNVPCEEEGRVVSQKTRERVGAVRGLRMATKEESVLQS